MKSLQQIAIVLVASITLSSCSSNGAERANDLCDCAMDGNMISMEAMLGLSFMSLEDIVDLALSEDGLDELFGVGSYEEYEYEYDDYENDVEYSDDYDL